MIRTVNIVDPFYEARNGRWFEKRKTVMGHDIYVFKKWNLQYLLLHLTNPVVSGFFFVHSNWNTGEHAVKTLRVFVNYKHVFLSHYLRWMVFVLNILDVSKLTKDITCFVRGFWFPKILFGCQKFSSFRL